MPKKGEKKEKLDESTKGSEKDTGTKKKDKKRRRQSKDDEELISNSNVEEVSSEKETKQKKKEKKSVDAVENSPDDKQKEGQEAATEDKERRRFEKKEERLTRRREKDELLQKVPKVDESGIAYTKLQIKRMLKRVKQGLDPVATEEEERERLRREAELRREEEAELAGMFYKKEDSDDDEPNGPIDENSDNDAEANNVDDEDDEEESPTADDDMEENHETMNGDEQRPKKKSKRAKPVPSDYVCQACKNKHSPAHWIYDCPDKETVKDVQQLFQSCGKVASCRLVKFGDTGRCNGQAYVTFGSDAAATKALTLSGTSIDNSKDEKKTKGKKADASSPKRRDLKLKISRVLNRRLTKTSKKPQQKA